MAWIPLFRSTGRGRQRGLAAGLIALTALGLLATGPAAAQEEAGAALVRAFPDGVDIAECSATPRAPGSVAGLVGTEPTVAAILPQVADLATVPGVGGEGVAGGSTSGGGGATAGWPASGANVEAGTSNDSAPMTQGDAPKPATSGTSVGGATTSGGPIERSSVLPDGLPVASDEAMDGIARTLRQLSACRFTQINPYSLPEDMSAYDPLVDYDGAYFALFSDDYFRRNLVGQTASAKPLGRTVWSPTGPAELVVREARVLEDGRVAVTVGAASPFGITDVTMVFVQTDAGWKVDELVDTGVSFAAGSASDMQAQTNQFTAAQYLEICLRDDGGMLVQTPEQGGMVIAGQDVTVTVANIGTSPQRFEVADLGIALDVPAGHSVSVLVRADIGTYTYQAVAIGDSGVETATLDGSLEFVAPGTNIPLG